MRKSSRRSGFTLPEVLVTVTIVAVLAAVMVPAVINQVAKGDSPAVSTDLGALRTAITTFAADTRRFPRTISQLGKSSITTSDSDITAALYDAPAVAGFHGPYAAVTVGHVGPTGAVFSDSLVQNAGNHSICMTDSTASGHGTGASKISPAQMALMESALDGGTGPNVTGSVQWAETAITGGTIVTPGSVRVCLTTY